MGDTIEAITHRNPHPVDPTDYFKMVEARKSAAYAKMAFGPLEASIILYGSSQSKTVWSTTHMLTTNHKVLCFSVAD